MKFSHLASLDPEYIDLLAANELELDFYRTARYVFEAQNVEEVTGRINLAGISSRQKQSSYAIIFQPALVKRIKYSSPGSIDIAGIGKVFETLKEVLFFYLPNKRTRMEIELQEQELISKKIDNYTKMGYNQRDIQILLGYEALHIDKISKLVAEGRIVQIEVKHPNQLE